MLGNIVITSPALETSGNRNLHTWVLAKSEPVLWLARDYWPVEVPGVSIQKQAVSCPATLSNTLSGSLGLAGISNQLHCIQWKGDWAGSPEG